MAVDAKWLEGVRSKNRAAIGLEGLGAHGSRDMDIVRGQRTERELRTISIQAGRFERTDPNKPTEGSIESIAQAIGPAGVQAPAAAPLWLNMVVGVSFFGLVAFVGYKIWTK